MSVANLLKLFRQQTVADGSSAQGNVRELFDFYKEYVKNSADAMAADTTDACFYQHIGGTARIVSVNYLPDGTLTGHASNYATLSLLRGTVGAFDTAFSRATDTATTDDMAADTPWALTASSTDADMDVAEGDIFKFAIAKTGSGVVVPAGALVVQIRST